MAGQGTQGSQRWVAGWALTAAFVTAAMLFACWASSWVAAASAAPGETIVRFDNLPVGTPVSNQYEAEGLKLGLTTEFPGFAGKLEGGDCGSPVVGNGIAPAASEPNYATLTVCEAPPGAIPRYYSGTFGALLGHPRGSVSVLVRDLSGAGPVSMSLTGYDAAGNVVASGQGNAESAWTELAATQQGGTAQISFFAIATAKPVNTPANAPSIAIDNLSFEKAAEEPGGGEPGGGTGGGGGSTGGGGGSPGGGSPGGGGSSGGSSTPTPPTAALALQTTNPGPGEELAISGAGSQAGSGRIISYDWDINGDGKVDTSTGANPVAHVILAPGAHTIGLTVTNSGGQSSTSKIGLTVPAGPVQIPPADGGQGPCEPTYEEGEVNIIAECIQKLAGGGYVIETRQLELDGMVLAPSGGGYGVFKIQTVKDFAIDGTATKLSGTPVNIELLNTPIGDVTLGGRNLESEPIQLAIHSALNHLTVPLYHGAQPYAHSADDEEKSKKLLMSFGVGHACSGGSKAVGCCPPGGETSACATLPGNFPLTGQVVVYLNNKGQSLFDVQVGLELTAVNFQATGALEIEADPREGINLNSLKFAIPEASLASIFKVKDASFVYYFPSDPEASKRDTWQAKAKITFGLLESPGLEGELAFQKGEFHSASLVLTLPPGAGVPLYPGIELNKLGGSIGVNPFSFGGTLGASIATQLELTLAFKFREATESELGFFGGKGTLSFKEDEIATLAVDVYSDGYVDAQVKFDLHFPFDSSDPVIKVFGEVGFWDEPPSGLWQAEGILGVKLWIINAEVGALVNNTYAAGCLGGEFGIQGRYRFSDGNIDGGFYGFSNCSDQLKQYQQTPLVKHSGGFVGEESLRFTGAVGALSAPPLSAAAGNPAGAAGETFTLPSGKPGEELRISSASGTPMVTLTGPSGQAFTTPSTLGQTATVKGQFIAAVAPNPHQVLVFLRHPRGGTWRVQPLVGSPTLSTLETAEDVPPATVRVHVRHRGARTWTLAYKIAHYLPGTKVRFVERGRDSTHVLGVVSRAAGTLRFTPEDALGRSRKVLAYLLDAEGATVRSLTVGRYTAPVGLRPGRPRQLRIVRSHTSASALVSWKGVPGARVYRIQVRGSDGRIQTFFRALGHLSVQLEGVLPFERFTVRVTAVGGPNMLAGRPASARLNAVRAQHHAPRKPPAHTNRHKRGH